MSALAVDEKTAQETIATVEKTVKNFTWQNIAVLVAMLVACVVVIKIVLRLVDRTMERAKLDRGVRAFLRSGLNVILWIVAICVLLGYIGVPMTSLVALVSVLGLAISLAVQGTLSNLAGGIMILSSHPFKAGDYVDAGGTAGTVVEVGLVYTKLKTPDGKIVHIPNGDISGKTITNYSAEEKRRVDLKFTASYDAPIETVKGSIDKVIRRHPLTLDNPEPFVRVSNYGNSSIEYTLRVWCANKDYWDVYFDIMEGVKKAFDAAGVEMTYDHLNVHMIDK